MLKLSITDIIHNIESGLKFEAVAEDYSFTLKIDEYVPFVCAAVHDGHQFRKSLWDNCLHTAYERWYEEDPCTKQMIQNQPIVLAGCDSRFEYDLNRAPDAAIYTDAWGKKLWKNELSAIEKRISLQKHQSFYKVTAALLTKLEVLHPKVLVFDMHSYNWKRWDREVPTWNMGTKNIDTERFGVFTEAWRKKLEQLQLPNGLKSTSKLNDTFQGNGYFLKFITQNFTNSLVFATEMAKIYCDEESGVIFPEVVQAVATALKNIIPLQVTEFSNSNV
ncbi:N-formylglutamate amidohydrolase [Cellulophaga sp. F20128]|uniref:N-formylglutamate amidohydrolase n=1 Tax=Cellulophaga sp. F20128 TaxID=2926413 RepID=UPI001FF4BEA5|nr:N-formylglutamate amidohydrolase [Cellulophaga sp. F20128]MCK0158192.1 N-formylglutamate amidohydrolase [Cellulophaga sp. F20128]